MILFKKQLIPQILNGEKTQTRRLGSCRWKIKEIHEIKTQYKEQPLPTKILIIKDPYQQELSTMTLQDAAAEGKFTINDTCKTKLIDKIFTRVACSKCPYNKTCFQLIWISTNGAWHPTDKVWVINFQVVKPQLINKPRLFYNMTIV